MAVNGLNMSDDLERSIEEGRKASEALLTAGDPHWRSIMLWVADAVAEEVLIRLQADEQQVPPVRR